MDDFATIDEPAELALADDQELEPEPSIARSAVWWTLALGFIAVSAHAIWAMTGPLPLPPSRGYYVHGETVVLPQGAAFSIRMPFWPAGYDVRGGHDKVIRTGAEALVEAKDWTAIGGSVQVMHVPMLLSGHSDDYAADLIVIARPDQQAQTPPPDAAHVHVIARKHWKA